MREVCVSIFKSINICWYLKSSISILKRNMNSIMLVLHISRLRFWLRGERGAQPCPRKRYIKSVHQWDREATVLICRYLVFVLYISIVSSYIPFLMVATSRDIYILRENDIYQQLEWSLNCSLNQAYHLLTWHQHVIIVLFGLSVPEKMSNKWNLLEHTI